MATEPPAGVLMSLGILTWLRNTPRQGPHEEAEAPPATQIHFLPNVKTMPVSRRKSWSHPLTPLGRLAGM